MYIGPGSFTKILNSRAPDRRPSKQKQELFQAWKKRKTEKEAMIDMIEENKRQAAELDALKAKLQTQIEAFR